MFDYSGVSRDIIVYLRTKAQRSCVLRAGEDIQKITAIKQSVLEGYMQSVDLTWYIVHQWQHES